MLWPLVQSHGTSSRTASDMKIEDRSGDAADRGMRLFIERLYAHHAPDATPAWVHEDTGPGSPKTIAVLPE